MIKIREGFGGGEEIKEKILQIDVNIHNNLKIIMDGSGDGKPWTATQIKKFISTMITLLRAKIPLLKKFSNQIMVVKDEKRISILEKILKTLDEVKPVDKSILNLIKSIF